MPGLAIGTEAWMWVGAWALVLILVVWLLVREPHHQSHENTADILRDRFARGEINEAEFRQATAALDAASPHAGVNGTRRGSARHPGHGQEARHD